MALSKGKISAHFSRSTCPARQSSVTIWRALWHRVMLSSARTLMSLLLSHCTPEEPGGRRFIWTPFYAPQTGRRPASWSITRAQRRQRSDYWARRVPAIRVTVGGVTESNPFAAPNSSVPRFCCESRWLLVGNEITFLVMWSAPHERQATYACPRLPSNTCWFINFSSLLSLKIYNWPSALSIKRIKWINLKYYI